jgi:predicted transcriptional regulator
MTKLLRIGPSGVSLLGPLEDRIMNALWNIEQFASVSDVVAVLLREPSGSPSYSSVKAVLLNLLRKRHVRQHSRGRAKQYRPVMDRATFDREVVETAIAPLLCSYRGLLLARLANELADDAKALGEFETLLVCSRVEGSNRKAGSAKKQLR